MKKHKLYLLALATCSAGQLACAAPSYTWAPQGTAESARQGGDGEWNAAYATWWIGAKATPAGGNSNNGLSAPFGSSTEDASLYFNGKGGTIIKSDTAFFGSNPRPNRTHTLYFAPGSNYTITSPQGNAIGGISSGTLAHIVYNVGSGATLNFAGNNTQIALVSGSDVTAGPGILFTGGGTVNLNASTLVRNNSSSSRLTISGGTTVTFNRGAIYTSMAGNARVEPTDLSRIAIESGTLNIDGGILKTGYRAKTTAVAGASGRGFGVSVGAVSGGEPATLNLSSGELIALGDPRSAAGNDSYAGIAIGMSTADKGGTVNLNGGTLKVTNIRSKTAPGATAVLNLNGTTIIATSAESLVDHQEATQAHLQTRLDNFIAGFAGTENSHVNIAEGGAIFDTSGIDSADSRTATITSPMGGNGNLTKRGTNTLRLSATNTYKGDTLIEGGSLLISGRRASIGGSAIVSASATLGGDGTIAGNVTLQPNARLTPQAGMNVRGALLLEPDAQLVFDLSQTNPALPVLSVGSLQKSGSGTRQLHILATRSGSYTLVRASAGNQLSAADFTVHSNGKKATIEVSGQDIIARISD